MMDDHHKIRKASLNFEFNGIVKGFELKEEVAAWSRSVLGPAIDSVLSAYDGLEDVISIDELKLDIDLDNTSDWQKDLSGRIIHQLREKIQSEIALKKEGIVIKSKSASFYEVLAYFLKFGILPWNADLKSINDFKAELKQLFEKLSISEIKKLLAEHQDTRSIKRLTHLLDQDVFEIFITTITKENSETISFIFKDINAIIRYFTSDHPLQQLFLRDLKEKLIKHAAEAPPEQLIAISVEEWMEEIMEDHPAYPKNIDISAITNHEIKRVIQQFQNEILLKSAKQKTRIKELQEIARLAEEKPNNMVKDELEIELKEGVFISNAGAVIIAPFLSMMFSRTGITADNRIIDETAALALVNYCITGLKEASEIDLLLPKILCGIAPEAYIDMIFLTNENAIKEADEMLNSVIEHWTILKGTSIDGLREAFLQRNGKLVFSGDEWLLFVEQKPYDMLLEQLPWNIGMIRLPWMKNKLTTVWI
ncbi:MAG: hypothetical protein HGA23_02885 [Bacteroidales bacterium]|nr:hypothetical protein [Bacteroidales bacterium]